MSYPEVEKVVESVSPAKDLHLSLVTIDGCLAGCGLGKGAEDISKAIMKLNGGRYFMGEEGGFAWEFLQEVLFAIFVECL